MRFFAAAAGLFAMLASGILAQEGHVAPKVRRPPEDLTADEARISRLYREVLPAVVTILTEGTAITERGPEPAGSLGSGVLISDECHVLTAAHVVDAADRIWVRTQDGERRAAEHLFSESGADIALLRLVEADRTLVHAVLGDSDRLAVGQRVIAIGNPLGLVNSLSVGHISGFREFDRLYDGSILAEFIQTDAAINSGNSGGPLFDLHGRVVGIASQIMTHSGGSEGLGFAVAINTAKQLLALEERVWAGFEAILLDRRLLAELWNIDRDGALLVQRVIKSSPADKAGLVGGRIPATIAGEDLLLGGDLILAIGDQEACHAACLADSRKKLAGRNEVPLTLLRGGVEIQIVLDVSASRRSFLGSE
ncbi:MAG: trypsin-like peptidase domain-containing protein [Thermoanaerobaculia bacterium]